MLLDDDKWMRCRCDMFEIRRALFTGKAFVPAQRLHSDKQKPVNYPACCFGRCLVYWKESTRPRQGDDVIRMLEYYRVMSVAKIWFDFLSSQLWDDSCV